MKAALKDEVYAQMWWNIAASTCNEDAAYNGDIVVKDLTLSQLEKAQDLARASVAKD